jgi:hypothetical protein
MAHPYHHALSSVKKWGGKADDYLPIHNWFDASKSHLADFRHRALRHHCEGIFWAEEVFGVTITNSDGKVVPVRFIGEQHVKEDLGWIPTLQDWFKHIRVQPWMARSGDRRMIGGATSISAESLIRPTSTVTILGETDMEQPTPDLLCSRPPACR